MFVKALRGEHAPLGIGKQIDRQGAVCTVEFFEAPEAQAVTVSIAAPELSTVTIPEQTRIYYFNPKLGLWEIGRLIEDHGARQYCKFPNGSERWLEAADVNVRWNRPIVDPTAFLAGKISETPRFADGRRGFVRSIMAQRGVTMGMSALCSSAVELESHQIVVVRRVLQDPVQRYLLADEVGLGKTIEAGILIRQCLLDFGNMCSILIVVPDVLVSQWRGELAEKFFLGPNLDRQIFVVALGDRETVRHHLRRTVMLVIDEAHHLTGRGAGTEDSLYEAVAAAAPTIERILLLSATPVLHNERGFLEMLHLLDPDIYALDDEAGFRRRVEGRQMLAQIVAGLTPENVLYLDPVLDQLSQHFVDDALLQEHVIALRGIVNLLPEEDDPVLVDAIGRLRAHISEVYRLHRRILRHRRRNVIGLTPGRSGVIQVDYGSMASARLSVAMEAWRFDEITAPSDESNLRDCARVFFHTLELIHQFPSSESRAVALLTPETEFVGFKDRFATLLQRLKDDDVFEDRAAALVTAIRPLLIPKQQFVVFCSDAKTADRLVKKLTHQLGVTVDRHDPAGGDWSAFNFDPTRPILVCDRRAEEGLNLQGGRKIVVHYDLPLNPNRVEQRLGRADRYGSGASIQSMMLVCRDSPYEIAWTSFLNDALRVFDRSVASLQYVIEAVTRTLATALLRDGPEAINDLVLNGRGDDGIIEREIAAIDQQDALDALGTPSSDFLDAICEVDEAWRDIEVAASGWIETNLMFARLEIRDGREEHAAGALPFCYRYQTHRAHTLVPLATFIADCAAAVDHSIQANLARMVKTYPATFRRRTALSREGKAVQARLLRYGDAFIDGIWYLTQRDDRGQSTALWRYLPGHVGEDVANLFLRFDFIIETDLRPVLAVLASAERLNTSAKAATARRGDMALPPFFRSIWLDQEYEIVGDESLLSKLEMAYRPTAGEQGGRDFNLNPKRWNNLGRLRLPQLDDWRAVCAKARDRAEVVLREETSFVDSLRNACDRASAVDYGRLGQLRARAERRDDPADAREWAFERDLANALRAGILAPSVRVDAVTAYFLSSDSKATAVVDGRL